MLYLDELTQFRQMALETCRSEIASGTQLATIIGQLLHWESAEYIRQVIHGERQASSLSDVHQLFVAFGWILDGQWQSLLERQVPALARAA